MYIQTFAMVIAANDRFYWSGRNFWFSAADVCIRPLCSFPFPTEFVVIYIWYSNDLVRCTENPTPFKLAIKTSSPFGNESELYVWYMSFSRGCYLNFWGAETLQGSSPCVSAGRGYSRWNGMAVSLCCASSTCFRFSNVDANKGLLIKCFI